MFKKQCYYSSIIQQTVIIVIYSNILKMKKTVEKTVISQPVFQSMNQQYILILNTKHNTFTTVQLQSNIFVKTTL